MPLLVEKKSLIKIKDQIQGKIEACRTSCKLPAIIAIKRVIMLPIAINPTKQKTSYSPGNLYIGDGQYKGW